MDGLPRPPRYWHARDFACAGRPRHGHAGWQRPDVVVAVLAFVPYHVYIRSGLRHTIALRRDLIALHAHNQELAAENERLAREAEALRDDPAAIERVARDELGWVRAGEVVVDLSSPPGAAPSPSERQS